jgi:hypothetical protein
MSNDFYCRYGKHWTKIEFKIHTARQGDYICTVCEEARTKDWVKSQMLTRRKNDNLECHQDDD